MSGKRSKMCAAALNLGDVRELAIGEMLVFFQLNKGVTGTYAFVRCDSERLYVQDDDGAEKVYHLVDVGVVPTKWGPFNPLNIVVRASDASQLPAVNPQATAADHIPNKRGRPNIA